MGNFKEGTKAFNIAMDKELREYLDSKKAVTGFSRGSYIKMLIRKDMHEQKKEDT